MNRVVLFDLGSQDPDGATQFYAKVFDWKIGNENWDYWPVTTGSSDLPGIDGGITRTVKDFTQRVQVTIQVESIDETIANALENGAKLDKDKMDFGGFYLAYLFDPQEIRFGLIQYK
jgi:predicted enzyme related to lactoylglutathione lyase